MCALSLDTAFGIDNVSVAREDGEVLVVHGVVAVHLCRTKVSIMRYFVRLDSTFCSRCSRSRPEKRRAHVDHEDRHQHDEVCEDLGNAEIIVIVSAVSLDQSTGRNQLA